jgi:general secretion pathway protein D
MQQTDKSRSPIAGCIVSDARSSVPARFLMLTPAFLVFAACSTFPFMQVGDATRGTGPDRQNDTARGQRTDGDPARRTGVTILRTTPGPDQGDTATVRRFELSDADIAALVPDEPVVATLPPQPVPQFIDTMFAEVLRIPYIMGPGVAEIDKLVSLRVPAAGSKRAVFAMTQMTLRDYGVALSIENGAVKLSVDEGLARAAPTFIRSRTSPDTPEGGRPVVQFFELQSIEVNGLISLLNDVFPDIKRIKISARQDINSLVLSGSARDVASAAEIISQIDQPRFANAQVARIEPVYWSADRLAAAVVQALQTEGYQAASGLGGAIQRAVTFMPVPMTNQVLLFSNIPDAFDRALYWTRELDRPSALGDKEGVFVYQVRNTSAEDLGRLVASVSGETATVVGSASGDADSRQDQARQSGATNATPARAVQPSTMGGATPARVTIDTAGNRLLYRGTPSEFERALLLFEQLDTPPLQVLIETTIAEVTLNDSTRFGVEWFFNEAVGDGFFRGGTQGGVGLGATGLLLDYSHANVRAALNAAATNNNVNILSTPRIVARSGGEAQIQVGTDVPIITSQRAADTQAVGSTDILQTVQYRQTGVILNVRPVVYGDRVSIEIFQEVSSQQENENAAIASPLILNRSVTTEVSLREGSTAVIGGLMQDNYGRGQTGIPLLKDIPLVGGLFRSESVTGAKTELLIMVTPHIIRTGEELEDAAAVYSGSINRQFASRGPDAYTLLPWRMPFQAGLTHEPASILEGVASPAPEAPNFAGVSPAGDQVAAPEASGGEAAPGEGGN